MTWNYSLGRESAIHLETGVKFIVKLSTRSPIVPKDLEIYPDDKGANKWSVIELDNLRQDLWHHIENEKIRNNVIDLVQNQFLGDRHRVASAIAEITEKNVSARTIQAWLIAPGKTSSRKCPAWALKAMKDYLAKPENKLHLDDVAKNRTDYPAQENYLYEVYDKHEVKMATDSIEDDARALKVWREADFNTLPEKLFQLEKLYNSNLSYLNNTISAIYYALRTCKNFEEFGKCVTKKIDDKLSVESAIKNTRNAIEHNLEEFSNEEGLAKN